jgi:hypothetical protein
VQIAATGDGAGAGLAEEELIIADIANDNMEAIDIGVKTASDPPFIGPFSGHS